MFRLTPSPDGDSLTINRYDDSTWREKSFSLVRACVSRLKLPNANALDEGDEEINAAALGAAAHCGTLRHRVAASLSSSLVLSV